MRVVLQVVELKVGKRERVDRCRKREGEDEPRGLAVEEDFDIPLC